MKIATRVALLSVLALVCAAPALAASPPRAVTAPTGLALASHTQTSLGLKWSAVRSASGYNVLLNGATVASTSGTNWTYLRLACGTRYTLGVTAKGWRSTSAASNLTATTDPCPSGDITPPTSPSGLAVTAVGTSSATVSWRASSDDRGVTGYRVAIDGGSSAATTALSYALSGLLCGTSHSVSVAAYDAAGNLSAPGAATFTTAACPDTTPPTAPTGLLVSAVTASDATATWSPATDNVGVAGYRVALDGAAAAQVLGLSYAYSGLVCGTSHTVTVAAVDAAGNLGAAAATSFATGACQATQGSGSGPAAPTPPSTYTVPAGATLVTTAAQLSSALGSGVRDIVLADGTYASSTPFTDGAGSHLYAQHLGGAVLTAGLVVGGNSGSGGAIVQGVSFNVSNAAATMQGGEVTTWGAAGAQLQVLDCTFQGNRTIPMGIYGYNPSGLVAERLVITNFTDEGIRASDNTTVSYGTSTPTIDTIADISVDGVTRSTPGASNGTAEAGIWIGQPVRNGVHRIKIRNVSWSGLETVNNAWDTTFTDLDIDMSGPSSYEGVGVYMEHFSRHDAFQNFRIVAASVGLKAEWDDPAWGGVAAGHQVTIQNGVVDATGWTHGGPTAGVFLDEGSDTFTINGVSFRNQSYAGIDAFNVAGQNDFGGNTYQLAAGAVQQSSGHM